MTNIKIVIGANYGDEGKGLMTDYFCEEAISKGNKCLVVCSNGGSQRGHTVVAPDGIRHVFHHFGAGTLAGADSYLSEEYIVNPIVFCREYKELTEKGFKPVVFVHSDCRWSTPFDMIVNQIVEESRGEKRHGSCGIGIWETIVRYETFSWTLKEACNVDDFVLKKWMLDIRDEYLPERLKELGVLQIPESWQEILYSEGLINSFISDFRFFMNQITLTDDQIMKTYPEIVFENGQGLLLDQNILEHQQHTTPSNTGLENPRKLIDHIFEKEERNVEVCYVTRTYLTRHGAGPLDNECAKEMINKTMVDLTNVPNPHQGTLRYGQLDIPDLFQRIYKDFGQNETMQLSLAVTHINEFPWQEKNCTETISYYFSEGEDRTCIKKRIQL